MEELHTRCVDAVVSYLSTTRRQSTSNNINNNNNSSDDEEDVDNNYASPGVNPTTPDSCPSVIATLHSLVDAFATTRLGITTTGTSVFPEIDLFTESVLLVTLRRHATRRRSWSVPFVRRLLRLAAGCAAGRRLADVDLPLRVFRELLDTSTLAQCQRIFPLCEECFSEVQRAAAESGPRLVAQCTNLLLQICRSLMNRMSRMTDHHFVAEVLKFLARVLSLDERSGVNPTHALNTESSVVVEEEADDDATAAAPGDEAMTGHVDRKNLNYLKYKNLWTLQEYFKNPLQAVKNDDHFRKLAGVADEILRLFESTPLSSACSDASSDIYDASSTDRTHPFSSWNIALDRSCDADFERLSASSVPLDPPCYLTTQAVFPLQISDSRFRRTILVQMAILFDSIRNALSTNPADGELVLKDTQKKKLESLELRLRDIMKTLRINSSTDGVFLQSFITLLLLRERSWVQWKRTACPEVEQQRPTAITFESIRPRRQLPSRTDSHSGSSASMDDCDHRGSSGALGSGGGEWSSKLVGLMEQSSTDRNVLQRELEEFCGTVWTVRSVERFFETIVQDVEDRNEDPDGFCSRNDSLFQWRCLRTIFSRAENFAYFPSICSNVDPNHEKVLEKVALARLAAETAAAGGGGGGASTASTASTSAANPTNNGSTASPPSTSTTAAPSAPASAPPPSAVVVGVKRTLADGGALMASSSLDGGDSDESGRGSDPTGASSTRSSEDALPSAKRVKCEPNSS